MNYRLITPLVIFLYFLTLSQTGLAAANGPYVGGQLGWANIHQGEFIGKHLNDLVQKVFPDASTDSMNMFFNNTGLAGRVFAGYQFNKYFATEVGYYRFSRLDLTTDANLNLTILKKYNFPIGVTTHSTVDTYAVDLVGKGIWPITDKFNVYAKFGLAYLNSNGTVNVAAKTTIVKDIELSAGVSGNPSINLIYPTFGLGMSYDITDRFTADLSYTRIQQYNGKCFPSIDFVGVGLIYHFD